MPEEASKPIRAWRRYLAALAVIVLFSAAVLLVDGLVKYAVHTYFPELSPYTIYVSQASRAIMGVVASYIVYRIVASIFYARALRRKDYSSAEISVLVLRVLFYFAAIAIALTSFGVSLSGALAGGAIGGVVLGLAVQTIVTNVLAGMLVSGSRTLIRGDVVMAISSYWGSVPILLRIIRVNTIYTMAETPNGNHMRIPNPLLLSYTELISVGREGSLTYPMQVSMPADVSPARLKENAAQLIGKGFEKYGAPVPRIQLLSKPGFSSNTYNVIITFAHYKDFNDLADIVNTSFDEARLGILQPQPKSKKR